MLSARETRASRGLGGLSNGVTLHLQRGCNLLAPRGDQFPNAAPTQSVMSKGISISLSHVLFVLRSRHDSSASERLSFSLDFISALFPCSLSLFGFSGNYSHLLENNLKGTLMGPSDLLQVAASVTSRFH